MRNKSSSPERESRIERAALAYSVAIFLVSCLVLGLFIWLHSIAVLLLLIGLLVLAALIGRREDLVEHANRSRPEVIKPRIGAPPVRKHRFRPPRLHNGVPRPLSKEHSASESTVAEPAMDRTRSPSEDDVEEIRRLRAKVGELKTIIADANEERASLRRQIATLTSAQAEPEEPPVSGDADDDRGSLAPDESHVQLSRSARRAMIPAYSPRANRSLRDLPPRVMRDTVLAVAGLATGDEINWRNTKQLVRPEGLVFSTRIGIRYRVLFQMNDGVLEVIEVIHRRELETVVSRIG